MNPLPPSPSGASMTEEAGVAVCPVHAPRVATATCDRCGRFACEGCARTDEGVTYCNECIARVGRPVAGKLPPWEQQGTGAVEAFFATAIQVCTDPDRSFAAPAPDQPARTPFTFVLVIFLLVTAVHTLILVVAAFFLGDRADILAVVLFSWMTLLGYLLVFALWAGTTHLIARSMDSATRGFGTTFRVASFACSPMLLFIVPVLGHMYAPLWSMTLLAVGIQRSHATGSRGAALSSMGGAVATGVGAVFLGVVFAVVVALVTGAGASE